MASDNSTSLPHSWLITGGCGFIGTGLIKKLVAEGGHAIRVLDNLSVGTREDLAGICEFAEPVPSFSVPGTSIVQLVVGDIKDPDMCSKCAKDMNVIVHLAANTGVGPSVEDPRGDMETNVRGTLNMLEAARHNTVGRFVFASSGAPVGECDPPIHEDIAPRPVSPYGASKLAGEGYCSCYFRTFGINTIALRFGNVYGPGSGRKNSVIAKFIKQAMDGRECEIYGDGSQTRDFIFIDDLIDAVFKAVSIDAGGEIFHIATSREHAVNEAADALKRQLEKHGIDMAVRHGSPRAGDVKRNFSDTSKAEKVLGWKAKVDLLSGIERTVAWFLKE